MSEWTRCESCGWEGPVSDLGWEESWDGEEENAWRTCPACEASDFDDIPEPEDAADIIAAREEAKREAFRAAHPVTVWHYRSSDVEIAGLPDAARVSVITQQDETHKQSAAEVTWIIRERDEAKAIEAAFKGGQRLEVKAREGFCFAGHMTVIETTLSHVGLEVKAEMAVDGSVSGGAIQ